MDIIFDLDGTLADCDHRLHHIKTKPKNYGKFYATICDDPIIEPISVIFDALMKQGHNLIFCTGREETCFVQTSSWINFNLLSDYEQPPQLPLYMRRKGDYRKDSIIKLEALAEMREHGYDPKLVFDDRPSVCKMWNEAGLMVCRVGEKDDF